MAKHQHVIAEWLLKLSARTEPGGLTLSVFDKTTGAIGRDVPSAAAEPVRRLVARVAAVGPGLWPLAGTADNLTGTGLASA